MRLRTTLALCLAAASVAGPALAGPRPDSNVECRPDTGFPPGNPSAYVCVDPVGPCVRWGVRFGNFVEGRNCVA